MKWLAIAAVALGLLWSAPVSAQCGVTAEGDLSPTNTCEICRNQMFESLPLRTACSAETRVHCGANGIYREECIANLNDPGGPNQCGQGRRFGEECPNGLLCDQGFCLPRCTTNMECRPGFECAANSVCAPIPGADMGPPGDMGGTDMGSRDMGGNPDLGVSDAGREDAGDLGENDAGPSRPDSSTGGGKPPSNDGCCAVVRPTTTPAALLLALLFLVWRRRD